MANSLTTFWKIKGFTAEELKAIKSRPIFSFSDDDDLDKKLGHMPMFFWIPEF